MPKTDVNIKIDKKPYYALFFAISILLFIILVYSMERDIQYVRVQRELTEQFVVTTGTDILEETLSTSITDLFLVTKNIQDTFNTTSSYSSKVKKTENFLNMFAEFKPQYAQFRLIDMDGNEVVNVLNGYSTLSDVPEGFNYSNTEFFKNASSLSEGYMYISDFDLYTNENLVSSDSKATLRYCTPIYVDGDLFGILVLNTKVDDVFQELNNVAHQFDTNLDLLTNEGAWISTTTSNFQFGFRYSESDNENFETFFPDEWSMMVRSPANTISQSTTEEGLFTYTKLELSGLISSKVDQSSKVVFEIPTTYLTAYTLSDSGYSKIFVDTKIDDLVYTVKNSYTYIILILLVSALTTALFYYRGVSVKKIKFHSDFDSLTATYNRRAGMNVVKNLINSGSTSHLPLSICFLDINGLKDVNDTLGHQFGDELIVTSTNTIKRKIRSNDILMRVGGDEFILILMNCTERQAESVWLKIEESFDYINMNEDRPYNISLAHGISEYNFTDTSELDNVLTSTDQLMYENKKKIKETFKSVK